MGQLEIVELTLDNGGVLMKIHPVVLQDEKEVVLIDCGYTGLFPQFKKVTAAKGIDLRCLTKIIITHHDHDHIGILAELKRSYPGAQVLASAEQAPYISGKQKPLRAVQAEELIATLPDGPEKEEARRYVERVMAVETVPVDGIIGDGDHYSCCGGFTIVATPGHMPGHLSVYSEATRTLITGDALNVENGRLKGANPRYTLDMTQARASIRNLRKYDIERVIAYHGGLFTGDVGAALDELGAE